MTPMFYIATGCAVVGVIGTFIADDDMRGKPYAAIPMTRDSWGGKH